jgi:hypothetical protein
MFRWLSQDTEEIAELLVLMISVFRNELKHKDSDSLAEAIKAQEWVREFHETSPSGLPGFSFYSHGKLNEFLFDITDERKNGIRDCGLSVTTEEPRYYGFGLYCNLLTGVVTVDARDSMFVSINRQKATRKARKLCKVFARKYAV